MKIGFYSPYLNILGGGERYLLTMASILSANHEIDVFGNNELQDKAESFLGIDLKKVNFIPWVDSKISRMIESRKYDRFFYVTDGSIFVSLAKKNFLIVQVPQKNMYTWNLKNKAKLALWSNVLVYSNYVKNYIDKWWHTNALIFPPAIDGSEFKTLKKENIILSVGRFFPLPHSKKQEVLVSAFKNLCKQELRDWKLILAGGVDSKAEKYFQNIKDQTRGFPVEFYPNISREKLLNLYSSAMLYWHATGFGENLVKHPERSEHFGITILEAMVSGCVPLIYSEGGPLEIVKNNANGLYWKTTQELGYKTLSLINNQILYNKISTRAREKAKEYDIKKFARRLTDLIY